MAHEEAGQEDPQRLATVEIIICGSEANRVANLPQVLEEWAMLLISVPDISRVSDNYSARL